MATDLTCRELRDCIFGLERDERGAFVRAVPRPDLTRSERALLLALVEIGGGDGG